MTQTADRVRTATSARELRPTQDAAIRAINDLDGTQAIAACRSLLWHLEREGIEIGELL